MTLKLANTSVYIMFTVSMILAVNMAITDEQRYHTIIEQENISIDDDMSYLIANGVSRDTIEHKLATKYLEDKSITETGWSMNKDNTTPINLSELESDDKVNHIRIRQYDGKRNELILIGRRSYDFNDWWRRNFQYSVYRRISLSDLSNKSIETIRLLLNYSLLSINDSGLDDVFNIYSLKVPEEIKKLPARWNTDTDYRNLRLTRAVAKQFIATKIEKETGWSIYDDPSKSHISTLERNDKISNIEVIKYNDEKKEIRLKADIQYIDNCTYKVYKTVALEKTTLALLASR